MLIHLKNKRLGLYFIVCITLYSCYQPSEGCLDTLAANYTVSADDPCSDDCCTYPKVVIAIDHVLGDESYNLSDTLLSSNRDSFKILEQRLYLSELRLKKTSGNIEVRDSIELSIGGMATTIFDDIKLIAQTQASASFYSVRDTGILDSVMFKIGISDLLDPISLAEADDYTPLDYSRNMRLGESYLSGKITIARGPSLSDTVSINLPSDINFVIEKQVIIEKGEEINIPIELDYQIWYENVDIISDDLDEIAQQLESNLPRAIR